MCDRPTKVGTGWVGWCAPESSAEVNGVGAWHDLSHPLHEEMPRVSFFPKPIFSRVISQPQRLLNVTRMEMIVHIGTHIDSPRHFFLDGPALDQVPLGRLTGRGLLWPIDVQAGELIEPDHLKGLQDQVIAGDILILNSGWHQKAGTADYDDAHPSLSEAAAQWIVQHQIKMIGIDFPTPDLPVARRSPEFDYPIHRKLLANGVLIAEHLTNLDSLGGPVVEVVAPVLNIAGADGAPARILARSVHALPPVTTKH